MPRIRQYNRQMGTSVGNVQQRGPDAFGAGQARAIQRAGQTMRQVGQQIYNFEEQKELSNLSANISKAQSRYSAEMAQLQKETDPRDTSVLDEYAKRVEKDIDDLGQNLTSRGAKNYFRKAQAQMKGRLFNTIAQTKSELEGEAAVLNYTETANNLSASLINEPDALDFNAELHRESINNMVASGLISPNKAKALRMEGEKNLIKSSIRGWAKMAPSVAREKINSGIYDTQLGGDGKKQMLAEIDQAERAKELELQRRQKLAEEAKRRKQKEVQNEFLGRITKDDLTTEDILSSNLEAFGSGSKDQFLKMLETKNTATPKTNQVIMADLFRRINLPDGDPDKITDENELNQYVVNRQLTFTDLNKLRKEVNGYNTEEGKARRALRNQLFKVARTRMVKDDPVNGLTDPEGEEKFNQYMAYVQIIEDRYREEGKPLEDLYNPQSKDYLGQYAQRQTPQEIIQTMTSSMRSRNSKRLEDMISDMEIDIENEELPTRRQNESLKDYLKRLKLEGNSATAEENQ